MKNRKGIRKLLSYWFEGSENDQLTVLMFILLSVMTLVVIVQILDAYLRAN